MQARPSPTVETLETAGEVSAKEYREVRTDDGVTILYRAIGTGSRTLVLMHGWGGAGSGYSWTQVLEHLDLTGIRVLVPDLRGHGRSEQTSLGFSLERFAQDILAVADDAGAGQLVLVGFSMSGKFAQYVACTRPERVIGQILLAPVPAPSIPFPDEMKEHWLAVARSGEIEQFEDLARAWTKDPLPRDVLERYFHDVSRTSQVSLGRTLDMSVRESFIERLGETRARTLIVAGAHDAILQPEILRQVVAAPIPGARMVTVDCGHELPVEQPRIVAGLIEAFLAGLEE